MLVARLLPAALVIFAVGLIDDLFQLKPWQKLLGQLGAAVLAIFAGVRIFAIAGHPTGDWLGVIMTIVWLLACTNAFNLMDGMDGLAAGIGLFATLTIFTGAAFYHNVPLQFATLPLAGCLLAFLCYNFNPATIFLGDCGSLLIGFLLGCFGVIWVQKSVTLLGMTAPLMALAIPLLDTCLAIARRFLRHQPIFEGDRGHIHHKLLDRGLTPRRAALVIYGICGLAAAFSLLQSMVNTYKLAILIMLLFLAVVWIGVQYLGYAEFMVVGRMVRHGELWRAVNRQMLVNSFEERILSAQSVEEAWRVIRSCYRELGFSGVSLFADGTLYQESATQASGRRSWTVRVPLENSDYLELSREFGSGGPNFIVVPLVELIRAGLAGKTRAESGYAAMGQSAGTGSA